MRRVIGPEGSISKMQPVGSEGVEARAALRDLCGDLASAETQDEAIAATPRWVRTVLGTQNVGVSIARPDAGGRLRVVFLDHAQIQGGRRRSARRRDVFVRRAPASFELDSQDRLLMMLPLMSREDCFGVLEVLAPTDTPADRRQDVQVVASQLAIALRHLDRQDGLQRDLSAVRKAVSMGREVSSARSVEAALRAATRFVSDRMRAPVAVWGASDVSPDLCLVDVRGVGNRRRRELRAAMPWIAADQASDQATYAASARTFARILDVDRAEVVDGGDAVMMVGLLDASSSPSMALVPGILQEALRSRSGQMMADGRPVVEVAWTAHELKTPLLGVKAALELLLTDGQGSDSVRDRELLARSLAELAQLSHLIDEFLGWVDRGQPLRKGCFDLVHLVDEIVATCSREAGEERVVLHAPDSALALIDPLHTRTAISNILRNAVSYSRPGSKIEVSIEVRGPAIDVAIHNEGPRITGTNGSLFEPFVRGDTARRYPAGRGLGLFIARRVVEAHGGRIWFRSEEDGTTFFLRLPAYRGGAA